MSSLFDEMMEEICEKNQKISDLEAKLAESETQIKTRIATYEKQHIEQIDEIYKLKQQLAEKDKEIEEWIAVRDDKNKVINKQTDKINKLKEELKAKETLNQIFKDNREDKISFAIEQLEKVKEFNVQQVFSSKPLDNFIDNQIKQLKEGK